MYSNIGIIVLICLIIIFMITDISHAVERITGPWLWMIAPTVGGQGGANSTNIDSHDEASNGKVTEDDVARKGAVDGEEVGEYKWTYGTLPGNGNINQTVVNNGMTNNGDLNDYTSYALIFLKTTKTFTKVLMGVNSDDSIKVWINGEVVHTNVVNRGRGNAATFQDTFKIDLKKGNNLVMVKVSERTGGWGMYVGVDADYEIKTPDAILPVEPSKKLTTYWAAIKKQ